MTLTKELRRILDERGVKWCESFYPDPRFTRWESNGVAWNACEVGDGILLNSNDPITPEDVIAATVGAGTIEKAAERIEVLSGIAREYLHRYGTLMSMACEDVTDEVLAMESVINEVCGRKVVSE